MQLPPISLTDIDTSLWATNIGVAAFVLPGTKADWCDVNTRLSRRGFRTAADVAVMVLPNITLHAARLPYNASQHTGVDGKASSKQSTAAQHDYKAQHDCIA